MTAPDPKSAGPARSPLPLRLENVGYEAGGARLIEDVTLTIEAGGPVVFLGPNGAGKTLLLRLCHGLIAPASGSVRWAETETRRLRRAQSFVFQKPILLRRTAAANIDFVLRRMGMAKDERRLRIDEALGRAGLRDLAERPARVLSGGEQQRLALARAWAQAPSVLFLDEPTANLDPTATRKIEELIRAIGGGGVTAIMTTHDMGQARRLAESVGFMHRGRLLEFGPAADFFRAPESAEARAFLKGELLW